MLCLPHTQPGKIIRLHLLGREQVWQQAEREEERKQEAVKREEEIERAATARPERCLAFFFFLKNKTKKRLKYFKI